MRDCVAADEVLICGRCDSAPPRRAPQRRVANLVGENRDAVFARLVLVWYKVTSQHKDTDLHRQTPPTDTHTDIQTLVWYKVTSQHTDTDTHRQTPPRERETGIQTLVWYTVTRHHRTEAHSGMQHARLRARGY